MTFMGHSAVSIQSNGATILVDPFLTNNPQASAEASEVNADYIVVTHAHDDHLGDAIEIAKRCNATIVSTFEIVTHCSKEGCEVCPMHIGGGVNFPFGRIKLTQAFHGSTMEIDGKPVTLGNPAGVVITIGGKHVYHAGDTGLFGDMRLIGEDVPLDLALLPIGDRFTMGVKDAIKAASFLQAKMAVPIHYDTWPLVEADPQVFVEGCEEKGLNARIVLAGQSVEF
jgi:L-ascorbate metabolism protein UlaG (beta-lactamase superfamily)